MFKLRLVPVSAIAVALLFVASQVSFAQDVAQDGAADKPAQAEVASTEAVAEQPAESAKTADEHDHAHDDHGLDPAHVNMSDVAEDPAEWRSEKAIATLIVFGMLLLGLTTVAWKPIAAGLEKREKTIASNISNAEKAARDATAKLAEYEAKLATAAQESQQILADARKDAEAAGQRLIAAAQEEATRQRERAVADIESAKRLALNDLARQSTDIAVSLAQRIVGREVKADDHQALIQDMLTKLPSTN